MSVSTVNTPRARSRLKRPMVVKRPSSTTDNASTQRVARGVTSGGKRARSRLRARHPHRLTLSKPNLRLFRTGTPRFLPSFAGLRQLLQQLWITRAPYWPAILICLASVGLLYLIGTSVYPNFIADIPVSNSYLIIIILIWTTTTSIATLLFAHIRRGVLFGLWCATLAYFHLQSVEITPLYALGVALFASCLELLGWTLEQHIAPRIPDQLQPVERKRPHRFNTQVARPTRKPRTL